MGGVDYPADLYRKLVELKKKSKSAKKSVLEGPHLRSSGILSQRRT